MRPMLINSLASIQDGDRLQETVPMLVQAVDNWAANGICDHPLVLAVAIPRSARVIRADDSPVKAGPLSTIPRGGPVGVMTRCGAPAAIEP